ncbi:MAG: aminoacyl-tRNA hydrolase [Thermomicrobiales bacterium]
MMLLSRIRSALLGRGAEPDHDEDDPIMPGQSNVQLIVGLGNPGTKYAETRHNAGFFVVDELAKRLASPGWKKRFRAEVAEVRLGDVRLVLLKPQTYMNDSGLSVREALNWYRVPREQALIVVDDLDQPFGQLRIRAKGSAGGHNGLKSIFAETGSQEFPRLRIGIGRGSHQTIAHVLSRFSPEERAELDIVVGKAADVVEFWSRNGTLEAMNEVNGEAKVKAKASNRAPSKPDNAAAAKEGSAS